MTLDLRLHQKIYHALYSDVFIADGRIYKLFKNSGDAYRDQRAATIFDAQCDAYARARDDDFLRKHSPEFYGVIPVSSVLDEAGSDLSGGYNLQSCYSLELLRGSEEKVTAPTIVDLYPHVAEARKRFAEFGIDTGDASVFCFEDAENFKLIDFSTRNF